MSSTRGNYPLDARASYTQMKQAILGLPKVSHETKDSICVFPKVTYENGNAIIYLQIRVGPEVVIRDLSIKEKEMDEIIWSINQTPSEKKKGVSFPCKPEVVKKKVIIKTRMSRKNN